MSTKTFGKTPCHCKEYTLFVVDYDLHTGTAKLRVLRDGEPFAKRIIGVSFCYIPPTPSVEVIADKCCKQYCTNADGEFDVTFVADSLNNVRINVNIQLGSCGSDCCIRLTKCLSPNFQMEVCPMSYLSINENTSCNNNGCCNKPSPAVAV